MIQTNDIKLQEGIDYKLLDDARKDKKWSVSQTTEYADVPEGTTKNILNGTTLNPGAENLGKLCRTLGVPIEKVLRQDEIAEIEKQGIKDGDTSVLALKELYEMHNAAMKETNEAHINNIRAHYKQHHEDLVENFEKRLADKRELNDSLKEQIHDLKRANTIKSLIIALFATIFVVLFILEIMHPEHGWLRY